MIHHSVVFRISILFVVSLSLFIVSCANSNKPKLYEREKIYGTYGENLSIFHRMAEQDGGLGLKFPGYLIGIEKGYKKDGNNKKGIGWYGIINKENLNKKNQKYIDNIKKITGDTQIKMTFISHIVRYSLENSKGCLPYIKEDFIFNAYDKCKCTQTENIYRQGIQSLEKLKKEINTNVKAEKDNGTPFTHIFLYCMGWNTDQQESFRNYNSLLLLMTKECEKCYKGKGPFKPLFIGISWPSEWRAKYFGNFIRLLSYGNKADDADEVGLIWVNIILRDILVPIKKDENIPLILIGHSFGARVITRAVFSYRLIDDSKLPESIPTKKSLKPNFNDIDLVVGLQGAFSINSV